MHYHRPSRHHTGHRVNHIHYYSKIHRTTTSKIRFKHPPSSTAFISQIAQASHFHISHHQAALRVTSGHIPPPRHFYLSSISFFPTLSTILFLSRYSKHDQTSFNTANHNTVKTPFPPTAFTIHPKRTCLFRLKNKNATVLFIPHLATILATTIHTSCHRPKPFDHTQAFGLTDHDHL